MAQSHKRILVGILAAGLAIGTLSACNTVRGAAQDVQAGGNAVEGAANDVQADMQMTAEERAAKEERDRIAAERAAADPH